MPKKIVFKDNIFQINEYLEVIKNGIHLDLDEGIFYKKIINDLVFFDFALQNIFAKIEPQTHLPEYVDTMDSLYFCITKYVDILGMILSKKEGNYIANNNIEKFDSIYTKYQDILEKIRVYMQNDEITQDAVNIVSQNELSELLNFG